MVISTIVARRRKKAETTDVAFVVTEPARETAPIPVPQLLQEALPPDPESRVNPDLPTSEITPEIQTSSEEIPVESREAEEPFRAAAFEATSAAGQESEMAAEETAAEETADEKCEAEVEHQPGPEIEPELVKDSIDKEPLVETFPVPAAPAVPPAPGTRFVADAEHLVRTHAEAAAELMPKVDFIRAARSKWSKPVGAAPRDN